MTFATLFILIVAVGGPLVALIWWAVAAKMAPYDDEKRRAARRRDHTRGASVVRDFDSTPPEPSPQHAPQPPPH